MKRYRQAKRKAAIAIVCGLLTSFLLGGTSFAATRYLGTASADINVRSAPSTKASKTGSIKKGQNVVLIGSIKKGETIGGYTADMHFFKLSSGGYVAQSYIDGIKKETSGGASTSSTTVDASNSSSGGSEIIDENVEDLNAQQGGVTPVISNDNSSGVDIADSGAIRVVETTGQASGQRMASTTSGLNVRSAPSTSASVLRKLSLGQSATVLTSIKAGAIYNGNVVSGNWYGLAGGGYVSVDFMKASSANTTASDTVTREGTKTVQVVTAKSGANYYAQPSTLAFQRGTLKSGDSKTISSVHKDGSSVNGNSVVGTWYKLSNGYYVRGADVSVSERKEATTETVKITKTTLREGDVVVANTNLNVRSGPGTSYNVLRGMVTSASDSVTAVAQNGSKVDGKTLDAPWVKLKNHNGWVKADNLKYPQGSIRVFEAGQQVTISTQDSADTTVVDSTIPVDDTVVDESQVAEIESEIPEE